METTPESVAHLEDLISHLSLPSYRYIPAPPKFCSQHQKMCVHHLFVEEHRAEDFIANLSGKKQSNIWIYNLIEIHETTIKIESGYAMEDDRCRLIETYFLLSLCDNPKIAIAQWHLYAGGMSYPSIIVRTGKTSEELKQYIIS
ncbi:hypothetical protein H6G83_16390 [Anabaena azotica FACHB-119]|uniref:Uncharacterized protein n=1 Tax=Anabaena azotica FACHB-119 TaxID=947527 RepID=A0ABR8D4U4_9NOST|nr:hypothetical protein [Anabaena azotica FACHB-119]